MKWIDRRGLSIICIIIVISSLGFVHPRKVKAINPKDAFDFLAIMLEQIEANTSREVGVELMKQFTDMVECIVNEGECGTLSNPTDPIVGISGTPFPTFPPGQVTTDEERYAEQVTQTVRAMCTYNGVAGVVTNSNSQCLNTLSSIMSSSAISSFKNIPPKAFYLQCIGCAIAMQYARGRQYTGTGNAKDHANQQVPNYRYFSNIVSNHPYLVPGVLFVSTTGTWGHAGHVSQVYRDDNGQVYAFRAFECNWGGNGYMRHDRTVSINSIAGWQRSNSL